MEAARVLEALREAIHPESSTKRATILGGTFKVASTPSFKEKDRELGAPGMKSR
jgi:hypothetical protein